MIWPISLHSVWECAPCENLIRGYTSPMKALMHPPKNKSHNCAHEKNHNTQIWKTKKIVLTWNAEKCRIGFCCRPSTRKTHFWALDWVPKNSWFAQTPNRGCAWLMKPLYSLALFLVRKIDNRYFAEIAGQSVIQLCTCIYLRSSSFNETTKEIYPFSTRVIVSFHSTYHRTSTSHSLF